VVPSRADQGRSAHRRRHGRLRLRRPRLSGQSASGRALAPGRVCRPAALVPGRVRVRPVERVACSAPRSFCGRPVAESATARPQMR